MAANMYRVGDFVYFETSSSAPYQIRRIEELNKTSNGNVEAKVMCFYRRRDISTSLINSVDKHHNILEDEEDDEEEEDGPRPAVAGCGASRRGAEDLSDDQKHRLRHRELFLSRQVETLPATHIRGKCSVTLLNETELLTSYLLRDDTFFYSLVYDPSQKTLLADRGEIRVGSKYQAVVPKQCLDSPAEEDDRNLSDLEVLVWQPHNELEESEVDKFLIIARSVGTFARALDSTSSVRQPSLHMSAAAASRDVTLTHALGTLHESEYMLPEALSRLVPSSGPVLCRDQMEDWSASEANLFEEALDKYGKAFNDIRQDFLPWKSMKNIVEYYYMWKTTDRYVQQRRKKAAEAESKLKQVYIPAYNKPNPAMLLGRAAENGSGNRPCEGCATLQSHQWFGWGAVHTSTRLCADCWSYWKRLGGLLSSTKIESGERPAPGQRQERTAQLQAVRLHRCHIKDCEKEFRTKSHLARHLGQVHGLLIRAGSPSPTLPGVAGKPMKTRASFYLLTTPLTRYSRRVCRDLLEPSRAARAPFKPVNVALIKQTCQDRLAENKSVKITKRTPPSSEPTLAKLGVDTSLKPALLDNPLSQPAPVTLAFPKLKEPFALPSELRGSTGPSIMRKRAYEQPTTNGNGAGPIAKKPNLLNNSQQPSLSAPKLGPGMPGVGLNGPSRNGTNGSSDSPDDLLFRANDRCRKLRKQIGVNLVRKAARKPGFCLLSKRPLTKPTGKHVSPVQGTKTDDVVVLE